MKRSKRTHPERRPWRTLLVAVVLAVGAFHPLKADGEPGRGEEQSADGFRAPGADEVLRTLRPGHPRLMLDDESLARIRGWIEADPVAARLHRQVLESAERALAEPVAVHELRDGRRLLYVSGEVLQRVSALAYAFHLTGRADFRERAWADLDAAAGFKDWNPSHFLDTAVMTGALALGLDWLWDEWTPAQRHELRDAIVRLGLEPAMEVYSKPRGWHRVTYNWNQVCNGGIILGALAVAEEEPALAAAIVSHAVASIPAAMSAYGPDGAGREGVGYWDFGSRYNVLLLASLQSALGTDFGLGEVDGFRESGFYQVYMAGGRRRSFDFSDAKVATVSTPQHFWMGRRYGVPPFSEFRYRALLEGAPGSVWDLLWYDPAAREARGPALPTDRHFRGAECASMRDSWDDAAGFVVAMQGGSNRWTHRHHDLGSFILEADGVRWIIDSGRESETYQGHVNHTPREDFYRIRAEGHNTLVIDPGKGPGQSLDGVAAFESFVSKPGSATAVLDLGDAYRGEAGRVRRTFELVRGRSFRVTDEIEGADGAEVLSFFHTQAAVTLSADRRRATLAQGGKTLVAELVAPAGPGFELLPAEPGPASPRPAKQASNEGRRKLAVRLADVRTTRIEVVFSRPGGGSAE